MYVVCCVQLRLEQLMRNALLLISSAAALLTLPAVAMATDSGAAAGAATGAAVGAAVGGPVGAAVGAGVGRSNRWCRHGPEPDRGDSGAARLDDREHHNGMLNHDHADE